MNKNRKVIQTKQKQNLQTVERMSLHQRETQRNDSVWIMVSSTRKAIKISLQYWV